MRNVVRWSVTPLFGVMLCAPVFAQLHGGSSVRHLGERSIQLGPIRIGESRILPTDDSGNGNLLLAQNATLRCAVRRIACT